MLAPLGPFSHENSGQLDLLVRRARSSTKPAVIASSAPAPSPGTAQTNGNDGGLGPSARHHAVAQLCPETVTLEPGDAGGIKGSVPSEPGIEHGEVSSQQLLDGNPWAVVLLRTLMFPIGPMYLEPHAFEFEPEEGERSHGGDRGCHPCFGITVRRQQPHGIAEWIEV